LKAEKIHFCFQIHLRTEENPSREDANWKNSINMMEFLHDIPQGIGADKVG